MSETILLAIDLNDPDGNAPSVARATALAQAGGTLHVVNVVPDFGMSIVGSYFNEEHNAQMLTEAKAALEDWATTHLADLSGVVLHVEQGSIYDRVLKLASEVKADMIVVGAHSSTLQDYLIGPNAARIARHATQSVMVVR